MPDPDRPDAPDPGDAELAARRAKLDAALAGRAQATKPDTAMAAAGRDASGFGKALRLSSEFVAGILVGAAIGWLIDRVLGTLPFGLIVFLLLGFAAGVLNVMRAAGTIADPHRRGPFDPDPKG